MIDKKHSLNILVSEDWMTEIELQQAIKEFSALTEPKTKVTLGMKLCQHYLYKQYNFDECRKYGYESLVISKEIEDKETTVCLLRFIGISYTMQGDHQKSKIVFDEALELALQTADNFLISISYFNIGTYEHNQGNLYNAFINYTKALELNELCTTDEPNKQSEMDDFKVHIYTNIGYVFTKLKNSKEALYWSKKAIRIKSELNNPISLFYIASCYYGLNDFSIALGYFKRALKYAKLNNDLLYCNFCLICIGEIYMKRDQNEQALQLIKKSCDACEELKLYETLYEASRLLGNIHLKLKNYDAARINFLRAFQYINYVQNEETLADFYLSYSLFCSATGNYVEAYNYQSLSYQLKIKILDDDLIRTTSFLVARYEFEQKTKELEIFKLRNIELAEKQRIIEMNNEALMKTYEMKDNILVMISHDLKNYISSILTAYDVMNNKFVDLTNNKYIKIMKNSSQKALSLLKDLLIMSKIDNDQTLLPLTIYELNSEIDYLLESLIMMAHRKKITILKNLSKEPLLCRVNKDNFHRVIDNLCINAIKFTPENGQITVKTELQDQNAVIHIIDNGIGMNSIIQDALFQQYTKASRKGTNGEESTGLGLYIVKKILDKHFANITVISEENKGSEFIVSIPIQADQYPDSQSDNF